MFNRCESGAWCNTNRAVFLVTTGCDAIARGETEVRNWRVLIVAWKYHEQFHRSAGYNETLSD